MSSGAPVLDAALAYAKGGLAVTVCHGSTWAKRAKAPVQDDWQLGIRTEAEIRALWRPGRYVGIRCGDGVELLDFDCRGLFYPRWCELVEKMRLNLLSNLYVETSPSGGFHVAYKCPAIEIPGSKPLAFIRKTSPEAIPNPRAPGRWLVVDDGKKYQAEKLADGTFLYWPCPIETRGTRGQFVCAPSPGYVVKQNSLVLLPELTAEERDVLISAARSFDEKGPHDALAAAKDTSSSEEGPDVADDYAAKASVPDLLKAQGWKRAYKDKWTRPGKEVCEGVSGTLFEEKRLYVFSTNATPLEAGKTYTPFRLYAAFHHNGDLSAAARALYVEGYGKHPEGGNGSKAPAPAEVAPEVIPAGSTEDGRRLPSALMALDTSQDPNCLIGRRWLCRGGSVLMAAGGGQGKSTLAIQFAVLWALGRAAFGLTPRRPLKILFIQAENVDGDLSEMLKGVVGGLGLGDCAAALDERLVLVQETCRTGKEFIAYLNLLVIKYQPDVVFIDPVFSFLGGDASDQDTCSTFCRNGLNVISASTGCAFFVVHHDARPSRNHADRRTWTGSLLDYSAHGSAELVMNWPRARLSLREVTDGCYELRAGKRGARAGLKAADGTESLVIPLRHSAAGLCWVYDEEMQLAEAQELRQELQEIGASLTFPATLTELRRAILQKTKGHRNYFRFNHKREAKLLALAKREWPLDQALNFSGATQCDSAAMLQPHTGDATAATPPFTGGVQLQRCGVGEKGA